MAFYGNASIDSSSTLKSNPALTSLIINAFLFTLVYAIFIPVYETNDDVSMSMISAGIGRGFAPSEYLIHINVVIALALKHLNQVNNSIPWYGLFLILSLYLAHTALSFVFLKTFGLARGLLLYLAFFLAGGLTVLINLEFTTVSLVACAAAYLYFFYAGYLDKSMPRSLPASAAKYLPAIGLVCLSALIRWQSFLLMTLVCMPVILAVFYGLRKDRRRLFGAVLALAVACLLSFGARYFHAGYYDRGEWQGVLEHIVLRGKFTDFRIAESTEQDREVFARVGWSDNDLKMFNWRFSANEKLYSQEKLEYIVSHVQRRRTVSFSYASAYLRNIVTDVRGRMLLVASAAAVPFLLFNAAVFAIAAGTSVVILGSAVYMAVFMKMPPPWVFLGTTYYMFLLYYFLGAYSFYGKPGCLTGTHGWARKPLAVLGVVALAALMYMSVDLGRQRSEFGAMRNAQLESMIERLDPRPDQLYVIWGPSFPYEYIGPLKNLMVFKDINTLGIGNFIGTPISREVMRRFNIEDIYTGLLHEDVFMFISSRHMDFLDLYRTYMAEHYGLDVRYDVLFVDGIYNVVKFRTVAGPGNE